MRRIPISFATDYSSHCTLNLSSIELLLLTYLIMKDIDTIYMSMPLKVQKPKAP